MWGCGGGAHAGTQVDGVEVAGVEKDAEGRVLYGLPALPRDPSRVLVRVDWSRRFDHMQQHTGRDRSLTHAPHSSGVTDVTFGVPPSHHSAAPDLCVGHGSSRRRYGIMVVGQGLVHHWYVSRAHARGLPSSPDHGSRILVPDRVPVAADFSLPKMDAEQLDQLEGWANECAHAVLTFHLHRRLLHSSPLPPSEKYGKQERFAITKLPVRRRKRRFQRLSAQEAYQQTWESSGLWKLMGIPIRD